MDKIVSFGIGVFITFFAYVIFVILPVTLYAEAVCLEQGYPETRVTVGLEQYCMTLDGAVTVRVDHQ